MNGLGKTDQEDFATSFTETFAGSAVTAGEFAIARQVFQLLQQRFSESPTVRDKVEKELAGSTRSANPSRRSRRRISPASRSGLSRCKGSTSWSTSGPPGAALAWPSFRGSRRPTQVSRRGLRDPQREPR